MEGTSFSKLTLLITRAHCILIACLIQLNYAEVCYIRSHMGYGGCIRWFLPAEHASNCTSIKLGGYTTTFYKRSQIIEFDQPFISEISEDIQNFLKNRVPSIATSPDKVAGNSGQYVTLEDNNSGKMHTASASQSTAETSQSQVESTPNNMIDGGGNTPPPTQSSTEHVPFTTVEVCPNLTCPENTESREITVTETILEVLDSYNDSTEGILSQCGSRKIVICGCDDGSFFPIGVSYTGSSLCRCDKDGSLIRYDNIHVGNTVCENFGDQVLFFNNMDSEGKLSMMGLPKNCVDLYNAGFRQTGVYCVYPNGLDNASSTAVRCNMGAWPFGGWTVIQRRVNGSVSFDRSWTEYRNGFGDLNHEFWLGNENIYHLTSQDDMQLRIDITYDGKKCNAIYALFRVGSENTSYRLTGLGDFRSDGIENNALQKHVNASFSTQDHYEDNTSKTCAENNHGGWWFVNCHSCFLNGEYGIRRGPGIRWYRLPGGDYNIQSTVMMIKPVDQ